MSFLQVPEFCLSYNPATGEVEGGCDTPIGEGCRLLLPDGRTPWVPMSAGRISPNAMEQIKKLAVAFSHNWVKENPDPEWRGVDGPVIRISDGAAVHTTQGVGSLKWEVARSGAVSFTGRVCTEVSGGWPAEMKEWVIGGVQPNKSVTLRFAGFERELVWSSGKGWEFGEAIPVPLREVRPAAGDFWSRRAIGCLEALLKVWGIPTPGGAAVALGVR